MERSFESIVDELKARIREINREIENSWNDDVNSDDCISTIENLLDDFNQNLDDLKEKYLSK